MSAKTTGLWTSAAILAALAFGTALAWWLVGQLMLAAHLDDLVLIAQFALAFGFLTATEPLVARIVTGK